MYSLTFWKDALERALKSAAQAVLLAWGGGDAIANLFVMDFQLALGAALGGAALSLLTSIISAPIGKPGASLVVETIPNS
jgi:hypothetical protein